MKRAVFGIRALIVAAVLAALPAQAQTTCTIVATVSDAEPENPVDGAVIVVRSPALQGEQVGASDAEGRYRITLLPPGTYDVHVEATGYRGFDQAGVVVPLAKSIRVDLALAPLAVTAKAIVVSRRATPTIDQRSTTAGGLLERELLEK